MPRNSTTLTETWMNRSQNPGLHWCKQNPGLGCRVGKSGTKSWIFQRSGGNRLTLGRWPELGVRAARNRAADLVQRGRSERAVTLREALDLWAQRCLLNGGSEVTVKNRRMQFEKHVGAWMDKPLSSIAHPGLVRMQLRVGEQSKHAANDMLRHLGTVYRTATADPWPGANIRPLRIIEPPKRRMMGDPAAWWQAVQKTESPVVRAYWLFAALTGLRENDVKTARYSLLRDGWLHLPKPKGGVLRAFDLPLSSWALEAIRDLPREDDWIFPGGIAGHHICNPKPPSLRHLCSEDALRHHWKYVAEIEAGCPFPIVQRLLNHRGKRGVTDVYGQRNIPDEALSRWVQRVADRIAERLGLESETGSIGADEIKGAWSLDNADAGAFTPVAYALHYRNGRIV